MKAIVHTQYGPPDLLQFAEVGKPTPKDNEVLLKLCAASVNPLDLFALRGAPLIRSLPGLRTPKQQILGCDIAGRVEAVGSHSGLESKPVGVGGGDRDSHHRVSLSAWYEQVEPH